MNYRRMSFYQIWVRSFKDGNGDGIGDLFGVYEKLDYIKSLGVDGIWFSPLYPSPNADYGYDISDYKNIHPEYGDLELFRRVLDRAHSIGLKVIMDLVMNHTSDEHPWFLESRKSRNNPYSDYYIWRDRPNNWYSLFEGRAWEYAAERGQYYLHVFSKKQPDLNMDNPAVREEMKSVMRFWLDMGVDGFREDVITFISKKEGLPDGIPFLPAVNGMPYYKDGPHIHEYLAEFRKVCNEYGAVQIGEGPMTTVKTALKYLYGKNRSLDMMISFDHMMADCFYTEYMHRPFSLRKYKTALSKWQNALEGKAWNSLYLENHDHPRIVSRYGSERYRDESAKMLAVSYLFLKGTPFIYQGQEIGMSNIRLGNILMYKDISSINNYNTYHTGDSIKERLKRIHISSRDSARTPLQWDRTENAGFCRAGVKPWFCVNPNYMEVNAAEEDSDPESILNFYRRCLKVRRASKTLIYGRYREYFHGSRSIYMYERALKNIRYLVICSFSHIPVPVAFPEIYRNRKGIMVIHNYADTKEDNMLFGPYEARVYRFTGDS